MLKIIKTLGIKTSNHNQIISNCEAINDLLELDYAIDDVLEVDTIFELTDIISKLQQSLFSSESQTPYIYLNSALGIKGILVKDHPLYKEQTILDLINAKSPNSDFEIEVELSVKKMDEDFELIEDFDNIEELETYIEETFFNSAIDGILGMSGKEYLIKLIKCGLLSKFIDFVNNINTKEHIIKILSEALASALQIYIGNFWGQGALHNIKFENREEDQSEEEFFIDTVDGLAGHDGKKFIKNLVKYDLLNKFNDFIVENEEFTEEEKIEILSNALFSIEIK